MHWSRLAFRFAVLTVLVLHATCLETQIWIPNTASVDSEHAGASLGRCDLFSPAMASSGQHNTPDYAAQA
jgi:hypothetical protein